MRRVKDAIACFGARRVVFGLAASILALLAFSRNAGAVISVARALEFDLTTNWILAEGTGGLESSVSHSEGEASLRVVGSYWRRISSVALAGEGEPLGTFSLDVRLDAAAQSWESLGVVLKAPSVGVHWSDLGQVSLAGVPAGIFNRKSFAVPEAVRQAIRTAADLTILISINSSGPVQLDNAALFGPPPPPLEPPNLVPSPLGSDSPSPCVSHDLQIVDIDADFGDIWAGRETTETGKQAEPPVRATLSFDAAVDPALAIGSFVPEGSSCGTPIPAFAPNWKRAWNTAIPSLGGQLLPRDFNVVVLEQAEGSPHAAGAIAAGGDVTLQSFSLNHAGQHGYGLVSGGRVLLSSGSIHGDVSYAVPSTIPGTVSQTGAASLAALIDFPGAFANLELLSRGLSNLPTTGDASLSWSTLSLLGSEPELNVFEVDADALAQARSITIAVPQGASVVINITGPAPRIENVGISLNGAERSRLLWNASQAETLGLASLSLPGSILAPTARVEFAGGDVQGTLIARSLSGSGVFQHYPLAMDSIIGGQALAANSVELAAATPLARGCTYTFVIPKLQPLTSDGQCMESALVARFRVAALGSKASRELEPQAADRELGTLRRFTVADGINTPVSKAWARYAAGLQLSEGDLVAASTELQSPLVSGGTSTFYQQYFQGVPIYGFGYFAHAKDGNLRSALGKVAAGLSLNVHASVDEAAALAAVRDFLGAPALPVDDTTGMPLEGQLEIYAGQSRPSPGDFRLVWRFSLSPSAQTNETVARVDATTGQVTLSNPRALPALDPSASHIGQVDRDADTLYDGPRSVNVAAYQAGPNLQYALSSGEVGALETTGVVMYTGSPALRDIDPANWPFEWAAETDGAWSSAQFKNVSSAYWSSQQARTYGDSVGLTFDGEPWLGVDGSGETPVRIWYDATTRFLSDDGSANAYFYKDEDSLVQTNLIVAVNESTVPVNLEVLAHEQFHAMVFNGRRRAGLPHFEHYREAGSIDEGVADIFGIATVHAMNAEDLDWACMDIGTTCNRNVADPKAMQLPARYMGVYYTDFSGFTDDDCFARKNGCGRHANSTIVSHWAYLLAQGSGPVADACNIEVAPLAGTVDQSLGDIVDVVFQAAATQLPPNATFADLREATIAVADHQLGEEAAHRIATAWSAVGVGDPPVLSDVQPRDGAVDVEPWRTTFSWASDNNGPWELELSDDSSFENELGTFSVPAIPDNGRYRGSLPVTLTPAKRYYWRVKKQGADIGCWLASGTFATAVKEIELVAPVEAVDGYYQTGFLGLVQWKLPGGNRNYQLRLSEDKVLDACSKPGMTEWKTNKLALGGSSFDTLYEQFGTQLFGEDLEPDHTYYLYVQPTFDSDLSEGDLEKGHCRELKVRKARLGSFKAVAPMRGESSQLVVTYEKRDELPDRVDMVMTGDGNAFYFEPSDGAESYQLVITAAGTVPTVIYDEIRSVDHCGITDVSNTGEEDGLLRWWLSANGEFDAPCDEGEMDGDPRLLDLVRGGDLSWRVYALGADGERRQAWHVGDEQAAPGLSSNEAYFNWQFSSLVPLVGDRALIRPGISVEGPLLGNSPDRRGATGYGAHSTEILDGVSMHRIDNRFSYASGAISIRPGIIDLVNSPAPPIMNGVRLWYTWDDQPWIGPIDVRDEHFEHATAIPVTNGAMRVETIYLPMEFDYAPGTHRVAAQLPTHLVYDVIQDGPPMEPEPEPEPEPVCTKPPPPELDALHAFYPEEAEAGACAPFSLNLGGNFAFGWQKVPGAVKYNVEVNSITGVRLLNATVDSGSSGCKKANTCMYSGTPPIAIAPACGYSTYIFYVSAVNDCGKESDQAVGAIGYAGPYLN